VFPAQRKRAKLLVVFFHGSPPTKKLSVIAEENALVMQNCQY
jgi:hypothetical protein